MLNGEKEEWRSRGEMEEDEVEPNEWTRLEPNSSTKEVATPSSASSGAWTSPTHTTMHASLGESIELSHPYQDTQAHIKETEGIIVRTDTLHYVPTRSLARHPSLGLRF